MYDNNINVTVSGPVQPSSTYKTVVLKGNQSFASQATEPNIMYVIRWDFDLHGQSIVVPENCILKFDGGSLRNGTIVGQDTVFINVGNVDIWGEYLTREGTWTEKGGIKDAFGKVKAGKDIIEAAGNATLEIEAGDNVTIEADPETKKIVINAESEADEEDLTSVNVGGTDVLKFKDKAYNPLTYSGMGRKILRKNIVDDVNTLTQEMVSDANTIYFIQYDFDLDGATITIPDNCVLEFDGGSLSNGRCIGNNALVKGLFKAGENTYYYGLIDESGKYIHNVIYSELVTNGTVGPNGEIVITGSNAKYTNFLYSLKGIDHITSVFLDSAQYSLRFAFYDKNGYYVGLSDYTSLDYIYIPTEAIDGYCRLVFNTNTPGDLDSLFYTSNIFSANYITQREVKPIRTDGYIEDFKIDINSLTKYQGFVKSNGKYSKVDGYKSLVIPVCQNGVRYDTVYFESSEHRTLFAFVKTYNFNQSEQVSFCTSRPWLLSQLDLSTGNYDIPNDCCFIIVNADSIISGDPEEDWFTPNKIVLKNLRSPVNKKIYDDEKAKELTYRQDFNDNGFVVKTKVLFWNVGHWSPDGMPKPYYNNATEINDTLNSVRTFINGLNPGVVSICEDSEIVRAKNSQAVNSTSALFDSRFPSKYVSLNRCFEQSCIFARHKLVLPPDGICERMVSNQNDGDGVIVGNRSFNMHTVISYLQLNNSYVPVINIHIRSEQIDALYEQYGSMSVGIILGDFNRTNPNDAKFSRWTDNGWHILGAPYDDYDITIDSSDSIVIDGTTYYYKDIALQKHYHLYLNDNALVILDGSTVLEDRDIYDNSGDITVRIASQTQATYTNGYSVMTPTFWKNKSVRYDWVLYKSVRVSNFVSHTDIELSDHFPCSFDLEAYSLPSNPRYGYEGFDTGINKPAWFNGTQWITPLFPDFNELASDRWVDIESTEQNTVNFIDLPAGKYKWDNGNKVQYVTDWPEAINKSAGILLVYPMTNTANGRMVQILFTSMRNIFAFRPSRSSDQSQTYWSIFKGTTAGNEAPQGGDTSIGMIFFNTTVNKPSWKASSKWVDAFGANANVNYSGTWANRPTTVGDIYEGFKYMLNDGTSHFPIYAHISGSTIEWYKADGTQYTGS